VVYGRDVGVLEGIRRSESLGWGRRWIRKWVEGLEKLEGLEWLDWQRFEE
jgi:hypothetical protein